MLSHERLDAYPIARGSALECGACLDVAKAEEMITPTLFGDGKALLVRVVAMLSKMAPT